MNLDEEGGDLNLLKSGNENCIPIFFNFYGGET
jgi:hypothetical protein